MYSQVHSAPIADVRSLHRLGACTLILMAALGANFMWASWHNEQRCIELLALAACVLLFVMRGGVARTVAALPRPAGICLSVFFLLGLASTVQAYSLRYAAYEWSILFLLLLTAAGVADEFRRAGTDGRQHVLQLLGMIGVLYSLRVLLNYSAHLQIGTAIDMHRLAVGFGNARFLNHTQTALLPLIVLLCLRAAKGSLMRRVWFALAAFWWALIYVSEARATILGLAAGCAAAYLLRGRHAHGYLKTILATALAGAIVHVLGFILLPMLAGLPPVSLPATVVERTVADPTSSRTLLWHLALRLIAEQPWLGVGPHHFAHYGASLYVGAHPHDWMMQIGAEWGLPALLCLLGAMALGFRGLVRSGARIATADLPNQQMLVALLVATAAIFVDALFSGVIVMPQSQLAVALVIGCGFGWTGSLDGTTKTARPTVLRYVLAILAVTAMGVLAWSVAPNLVRQAHNAALTPAERALNPTTQWPRLWEAGYF